MDPRKAGQQGPVPGQPGRQSSIDPHKQRWMLVGILFIAALLRLWNLSAPKMGADESDHYFREMQQIHLLEFEQQRIHPVDLYHATSPGPSGHPLFAIQVTNLVMRVLPATATTARGVQAIAGVAMVGVVFLLGKDLFGEWEAVIAAGLAAVLPLAVRYNRTLYLDSIYSLLTTLVAWTTFRAFHTDRPLWTVLAGVCLGLAGATKTSAPVLVPFVLGYALYVCWQERQAQQEARRKAAEAARQASRKRKGSRKKKRTTGTKAGGDRLDTRQPIPAAIKLVLILILALIVFWVDVDPSAYWTAIRHPVDTGYQHSVLAYFEHLWSARTWVLGVLIFLWTPFVPLAALASLVMLFIQWRQVSNREVLLVLWLLCLGPLALLHLVGISGEHGYLPFVAPVCLLAASSVARLRGTRLVVALALIFLPMLVASVLYGWRLVPTPYGSYLNLIDFGREYY